jgi:hypothetical protein
MFAPRLLVSPDLVPRAVLIGLAPARSARPSVPSRPQRPLQSGLPMALHSVISAGLRS